MAKKKYYAIRRGMQNGIFETWDECKKLVTGYSGAEYKSFLTLEEAGAYLGYSQEQIARIIQEMQANPSPKPEKPKAVPEEFQLNPDEIVAYVDGSYHHGLQKYSFGCVIITPEGEIIEESGSGDNPESLAIRNIAGEMIGAMYAVKWGMVNGYKKIELRYDYAGIEHWVTRKWKAKNDLTIKYADAMNQWKHDINICFQKVTAHSNNYYNDEADRLAKEALTSDNGIPKIKPKI